jgi:ATP/ADP translocase
MAFSALSASFIIIILLVVTGIRLGFDIATNTDVVIFSAFVCIGPFNAIVFLIFWGVFGRIFSLRESKQIISRIDGGQLIASIIALFTIPFILSFLSDPTDLLWISSASAAMIFFVLLIVSWKYTLNQNLQTASPEVYSFAKLVANPYVVWMAIFVIVSMICIFFVNYSFLVVTADEFPDSGHLANFISIFTGTIIIFNFLIQNFVTDRIIAMYGLKVSLLINPLLLCLFTLLSAFIGSYLGYVKESDTFIIFFLAIALGKLFTVSLKDALDNPTFKLYFLPLDTNMRFNIQTRIEGVVTMFAGLIAGSILWFIDYVAFVDLIYFTYFLIPIYLLLDICDY